MCALKYPPSIDWEVTSACNQQCIYCYNYWRKKADCEPTTYRKELPEYYLQIANKIANSYPVSVQITGGEPFMIWDRIKPAMDMLAKKNICLSVNTNATLVTDQIAEYLKENEVNCFVSFPCADMNVFDQIVGCDGSGERAVAGIQKLVDYGVSISLNMVVTKLNLPYVFETAQFAKERFSIEYFSATKASFPKNAAKEFCGQILDNKQFNTMLESLLRVRRELGIRVDSAWVYSLCGIETKECINTFGFNRRCVCGQYAFTVDAVGNMKACGCDSNNYGNILKTDFSTAILKMKKWQDGSLMADICRTCPTLDICGGGCRSDSFSFAGSYNEPDSTANPHNRMRFYSLDTKIQISENKPLKINPKCTVVTEDCGIRISYLTNCEWIEVEFYEYLCREESFTPLQLIYASGQSKAVVLEALTILRSKKLIISATEAKKATWQTEGFSLLSAPYINEESSSVIQKYSESKRNIKRHMF